MLLTLLLCLPGLRSGANPSEAPEIQRSFTGIVRKHQKSSENHRKSQTFWCIGAYEWHKGAVFVKLISRMRSCAPRTPTKLAQTPLQSKLFVVLRGLLLSANSVKRRHHGQPLLVSHCLVHQAVAPGLQRSSTFSPSQMDRNRKIGWLRERERGGEKS